MNPTDRLCDIDDLDHAIVTLSARINTATYELLVLIREFDERAGWLQWGVDECREPGISDLRRDSAEWHLCEPERLLHRPMPQQKLVDFPSSQAIF